MNARAILQRSLLLALIVGTTLTAINQGNVIAGGDFPPSLYWKVPLTYCVPFIVATLSAWLTARAIQPSSQAEVRRDA